LVPHFQKILTEFSNFPHQDIALIDSSVRYKTRTEPAQGPFYVFLGDFAEKGTGKLFISKANNPQLKTYEKFL